MTTISVFTKHTREYNYLIKLNVFENIFYSYVLFCSLFKRVFECVNKYDD